MIFGGPHRSFKNDPAGMMTSNAVKLVQAIGNELPGDQEQAEIDLISFFCSCSWPGEGCS